MFRSPTRRGVKKVPAQIAKSFRALSMATLTITIQSIATEANAQQKNLIEGLPHALICTKDSVTVVGYLARVNEDGSAVYMTSSRIAVEVSSDGVVDNRADGTCAGKSLNELRDSGQTRNFSN